MTLHFSRTSPLALFFVSILPIFFAYGNKELWYVVNVIVFTFFFIWAYSIAKELLEKNTYDPTIKFRSFKVQLVLTYAYIIALSIYYAFTYSIAEEPKWMLLIIILGQCFLAWNSIYLIRFIAKAIATLEFKRKCHLADYLGNFVLLYFYPLGIWWLHPKIQKLIEP